MDAAENDAVADGGDDGVGAELSADIGGYGFGGGVVGFGQDTLSIFGGRSGAFGDELGVGVADAFDLAGEDSVGGILVCEDGEFDAGGAGVDGKNEPFFAGHVILPFEGSRVGGIGAA